MAPHITSPQIGLRWDKKNCPASAIITNIKAEPTSLPNPYFQPPHIRGQVVEQCAPATVLHGLKIKMQILHSFVHLTPIFKGLDIDAVNLLRRIGDQRIREVPSDKFAASADYYNFFLM